VGPDRFDIMPALPVVNRSGGKLREFP